MKREVPTSWDNFSGDRQYIFIQAAVECNIVFRNKRFFANTRNPSQRICICHWTNPCVQKSLFINLLYDCNTYLGNSYEKKTLPTVNEKLLTCFKDYILQISLFDQILKFVSVKYVHITSSSDANTNPQSMNSDIFIKLILLHIYIHNNN